MSARSPSRLVALIAPLLLAACASGPAVTYSYLDSAYSPAEIAYAGDGRDVAVTVRGALPDGTAGDELAARVVAAMGVQPAWFRPRYTTTPGESARPDYRVSWLIGVPAATPLKALCDPGIALPGAGSGSYAFAAVCRRDRFLSYAGASLGDIRSADDPRFARLVVAITREIMPRREPTRDGRSEPEPPFLVPGGHGG